MPAALRFVENKVTGFSQKPSEGVIELVFNRHGVCLMCGHTPGREVQQGACCLCVDCICCIKRTDRRHEEES